MKDELKDFIENNRDAFLERPGAELWTRIETSLKQNNIKPKKTNAMIKYGFGASAIIGITLLIINSKKEETVVPQVNNKAFTETTIKIPATTNERTASAASTIVKEERTLQNSSSVNAVKQTTVPAVNLLKRSKTPVQDTLDITNWPSAGSSIKSYSISGDYRWGKTIGVIESTEKKINGFITMMQSHVPDKYLGKRIRMTGYMRTENVAEWAGIWLRVGAKGGNEALAFDNMRYGKKDRSIKGTTERTKYEVVLDVPPNSANIIYGVMLVGTGKIYFDSFILEVVDESVATTGGNPDELKLYTNNKSKSYNPLNFWRWYVPGYTISKDGTWNINIE